MPPKKGGKKGKKDLDNDDYWANKEIDVDPLASPAAVDDVPVPKGKGKQAKSAYALLEEFEAGGGEDNEDGAGGGGLMSAMRSRKDRKPKGKKSAPVSDDDEPSTPVPKEAPQADIDDEWPEDDVKPKKGKKAKKDKKGGKKDLDEDEDMDGSAVLDAPAQPAEAPQADIDDEWPEDDVKPKKGKKGKKAKGGKKADEEDEEAEVEQVVAEIEPAQQAEVADLDDEWPEEDVKPKKGKKGKKQNKKDEDEEEEGVATPAAPATPVPEPAAAAADNDEDEEPQDGEVKILSKKEKEKLKKEKEKAKKKAQAERKKAEAAAASGGAPVEAEKKPEPEVETVAKAEDEEEDDDEGGAGGAGAADKKKKKKKKKAAEKAEPEPPKKKVNAKVAALAAAMERKKQIEEEARRAEEEARRLAEEEEARLAEEERLAEEARAIKRQKEKEKRDLARKEGRLLTPKQKAEKAAAEARMKALLASGVKVEGLDASGQPAAKPKKPVYGNKKKQPAKKAEAAATEPVKEEPKVEEAKPAAADEDDDWDKSETEEVTKAVGKVEIKEESEDDWDKSSDEEEEVKPAPPAKPEGSEKAASKPAAQPAAKPTAKPASKPAVKPAGKPAAKAAAKEESESESESESDEDSGSDDSDDSDDSNDSDDSSDESSSEDEMTPAQRKAAAEAERRKSEAAARRKQRHEEAMAARSKDDLRSPICCILGHVDTGKTKLLDKIRQTNVQEGEAGGITQQIGATYFPVSAIKEKTQVVNKDGKFDYKIPGLLIIDTPGHESFTNLRTRGSSLCNIAILVVDITHGLEPQTLESIRLLRERKTPFVVALNKIDRCYGWNPIPNGAFRDTYNQQGKNTQREFENRLEATKLAFAEQGFNAVLYDENKDFGRYVSLVPTSAITGEGIPDMIMLLVQLTQQRMSERLMYLSELECTVLEVKVIEGLGTTIDVVLSNGVMREGDRIVVCGLNGPIVTNVRALLTPQPLRELRVKSAYVHNREVKAALGIKISAPGLEKAIAGSRLLVVGPDDDEEELMDEIMSDLKGMEEYIDQTGRGVWVQASTLGSLEALLEFLKSSKIPVMGINIGPVYKRDIMRCAAMLEKAPEYAVVLSFDVEVDKDAKKLAEELNVKVFEAQIIYHLFDAFTAYMAEILEQRRKDAAPNAVWPCRLNILAVFAKRDPIVLGVDIIEGTLRTGTPICVVKTDKESGKKEIIPLGKISSIEINHKSFDLVKKSQIGAGAAIKIDHAVYQSAKSYGRHFDEKDELISHLSRSSIDVLKTTFRDQVDLSDWALIKALKPKLDIQ